MKKSMMKRSNISFMSFNQPPNFRGFIQLKKAHHDTKIKDIENKTPNYDKYFTTKFNQLTK